MYYFGTSLTSAGHYFWDITNGSLNDTRLWFSDLPFDPENMPVPHGQNVKDGTVKFFIIGDYSICAIAGSCRDKRPGSKSVFFEKLILSDQAMIARVKDNPMAMKIINQMSFPVEYFKSKEL